MSRFAGRVFTVCQFIADRAPGLEPLKKKQACADGTGSAGRHFAMEDQVWRPGGLGCQAFAVAGGREPVSEKTVSLARSRANESTR
jgi:hypothetical protein